MMEPVFFAAPWDQRVTGITVAVSAFLLATAALLVWIAVTRVPFPPVRWLLLANAAIPVGILVVGALMGPRGYSIRDGHLRVDRWLAPIRIPLGTIRGVEPLPGDRLAGALRTLGSGGFFGFYGQFRNDDLGAFRMYATRGEGYVLIRAGRLYVLTPESPDRFIEALDAGGGPDAAGRIPALPGDS